MSRATRVAAAIVIGEIILTHMRGKTLKPKRKRIWTREWIQRRSLGASGSLLQEVITEDPKSFLNHLRMTSEKFDYLLNKLQVSITKQNTRFRDAIPAKLKLQITLRYLATGDSFASLEYLYRVPKPTIGKFIPEVCSFIYSGLKEFIQIPQTEEEWKIVINGFNSKWQFPCAGAIDGKHVVIKCPAKSGSEYFNYKKQFSFVLMALADSNYCFTYIDVGQTGRASDGGTFSNCSLKEAMESNSLNMPPGAVIVGDEAFPLTKYLMKPFSRHGVLTKKEKIFNYRLSRARRVIENTFGIMVAKFRIFERPIALKPDSVDKIILAACALHNWLRKTSPSDIHPSTTDTANVQQNMIDSSGMISMERNRSNNYSREAAQIRNNLAEYFINEGAVSWQDSKI